MPTVAGILDDIGRAVVEKLEPFVREALENPGALPLARCEDRVQAALLPVGGFVLERVAEARSDAPALTVASRTTPGAVLKYRGMRTRTVRTTFGPVTYSRPYYRNTEFDESRFPRDEELGLLPRKQVSPRLAETLAYLSAATGSYDQGTAILEKLRGVEVEYKQAQREVLALGAALKEVESQRVAEVFKKGKVPEVPPQGTEALLVGCDGITTMHCAGGDMEIKVGRIEKVALQAPPPQSTRPKTVKPRRDSQERPRMSRSRREELAPTKQSPEEREYRDASGVVDAAVREAYPERHRQPRFRKVHEQSIFHATAALGPEHFGRVLSLLALGLGLGVRTLVLFLADGSSWCWNLATSFFPGAVQILDVFHLAKHLVEAANALWGKDSPKSRAWRHETLVRILRGELDAILGELATVCFLQKTKNQAAKNLLRYLTTHRSRMDYPRYVANGYPIGSSRIESACRHVIGARMKGDGRRWDDDGADAMARLRAILCSGQWRNRVEARTTNQQPPSYLAA